MTASIAMILNAFRPTAVAGMAVAALMLAGIVLCLSASPPVAARLNLDPFHFVNRQIMFLIPAVAVLLGAVAAAACLAPVRRALRADPVSVLKAD